MCYTCIHIRRPRAKRGLAPEEDVPLPSLATAGLPRPSIYEAWSKALSSDAKALAKPSPAQPKPAQPSPAQPSSSLGAGRPWPEPRFGCCLAHSWQSIAKGFLLRDPEVPFSATGTLRFWCVFCPVWGRGAAAFPRFRRLGPRFWLVACPAQHSPAHSPAIL